jgi:hydroxymethylpyrimidine pyrophosphatase-like HAD family hydrolase
VPIASGASFEEPLAWRAQQLGIGRDEVMAVGDNLNDLEMLEFAGTAVVMENGVAELKTRGWHLTGHQDAAGLAQAIERFAQAPRRAPGARTT